MKRLLRAGDDEQLIRIAGDAAVRAQMRRERAPQLRPASDAVPVLLRAELGCTRVTLDELQALALGDVVLVDTSFMGTQRALWLSADGQAGLQDLAGSATLLYYLSEEGKEGKEAFLAKRKPNFRRFRRYP